MVQRIIVLGLFRSGTSLSTRLVQHWGAYTGRDGDLFKDRYGYLEHLGLQKLNDEILDRNDRIPLPADELVRRSSDPNFRTQAQNLLAAMDDQTREDGQIAWVWKDPRLPLALPFWSNLWGDVIYVIPIRHPVEMVRSAASMDGVEPEQVPLSAGLLYWQYCMLNVLTFTRDSRRKIFVDYDQLVRDPYQVCRSLCGFLDDQCDLPPAGSEARTKAMASQVAAGEHHFREPQSFAGFEAATREQRALYNLLRVKTLNPEEAFHPDDFALYPGWREYLQAMDMLLSGSREQEG